MSQPEGAAAGIAAVLASPRQAPGLSSAEVARLLGCSREWARSLMAALTAARPDLTALAPAGNGRQVLYLVDSREAGEAIARLARREPIPMTGGGTMRVGLGEKREVA